MRKLLIVNIWAKPVSKIINVFMMDITVAGKTSGVIRVMDSIYEGLADRDDVKLHLIRIVNGCPGLSFRRISEDQFVIECDNHSILNEPDFIWKCIMPMFAGKENIVLDLNTLNLIYLAKFIQMRTGAKILSRLHCIAYQQINPADIYKFRETGGIPPVKFIHDNFPHELDSYLKSDKVVCVAQSGADYVRALDLGVSPIVVNNAVEDWFEKRDFSKDKSEFTAVFVGQPTVKFKAAPFALEALEKANATGRKIKLIIIGFASEPMRKEIADKYPGVRVEFTGNIPQEKVYELFEHADFGLIPSVTEQTNITILEMLMMGLPIIANGVLTLSETLNDESALLVPWELDKEYGLKPDTDKFAKMIIRLADSPGLRRKMSCAGRKLYLKKYTLDKMLKSCGAAWKELYSVK